MTSKMTSKMRNIPDIVSESWEAYGEPAAVVQIEEISAQVSTNRVYRLHLGDGSRVIAKLSSYGSFVHFRQDHQRIHRWCQLLAGTRFEGFLADVLCLDGEPYCYRDGHVWVAFYQEVAVPESLPRILDESEIAALGRELASFHAACERVARELSPTWKSLGSDIAQLSEQLEADSWRSARGLGRVAGAFIREHCDAFLTNADALGYHAWPKLPVLIDWNIGNFSIVREGVPDASRPKLRLFSRWDYDWFRMEPELLDFYFMSRVVSSVGDKTRFSYGVEALLEPRFRIFLRAYHELRPLTVKKLLFLKEAYRFFLLNYVVREGEHFFREGICERLRRDVVDLHLPALESVSFDPLLEVLGD